MRTWLVFAETVTYIARPTVSEVELIPLEGFTSKIWRYFGFPGKDGQFVERDKRKRNEVTFEFATRYLSIVEAHLICGFV